MKNRLVLASASPRRLELLKQMGIVPDEVIAADIDETLVRGELPEAYVVRMAQEKAAKVAMQSGDAVVLAADTIVAMGRRVLPKTEDESAARRCLERLSGGRHRVYTAVCVRRGEKILKRLVMTQVQFKRLSGDDIAWYLSTREWEGKAGGYAIQGAAGAFIPRINGSVSNVIGLPLTETRGLLAAVMR